MVQGTSSGMSEPISKSSPVGDSSNCGAVADAAGVPKFVRVFATSALRVEPSSMYVSCAELSLLYGKLMTSSLAVASTVTFQPVFVAVTTPSGQPAASWRHWMVLSAGSLGVEEAPRRNAWRNEPQPSTFALRR